MHAPGKQVAADEHLLFEPIEAARLMMLSSAGVPPTLSRFEPRRLLLALYRKDERITWSQVLRSRLFKHAQVARRQKERIVRRHLVPVFLIEIVDTVREREPKPARRMSLPMMVPNLPRLGDEFLKWFDVWHDDGLIISATDEHG